MPLEHDPAKCGSQPSFHTYVLFSTLTTDPSELNRYWRANVSERTPVHTKGHIRRVSVPVVSSGPNSERRICTVNLLLRVLSL